MHEVFHESWLSFPFKKHIESNACFRFSSFVLALVECHLLSKGPLAIGKVHQQAFPIDIYK